MLSLETTFKEKGLAGIAFDLSSTEDVADDNPTD